MHRQDGQLPDNKDALDCRRSGNPLGFTVTAGNAHGSKASRSLIQITEEKYLSKAGKHDAEERGQRDFLGDKGCACSVVEWIPAVQGWISALPSRNNLKKPKTIDKRIDQERRLIESDFERIKKARGVSTRRAKTVSYGCSLCDSNLLCASVILLFG